MTPHHSMVTRLGPRETVALSVTTVFFSATVALVGLGLPVGDILLLMSGTAGAAVVTVAMMTLVGTVRATREAEREAIAAFVRLAGRP